MRTRRLGAGGWLGAMLVAVAACGGDDDGVRPLAIDESDLASNYTASSWDVLLSPVDTADIIAEGGSIGLNLELNGETAGRMLIPPGTLSSELRNINLAGRWSWDRRLQKVILDLDQDVFLQNMTLDIDLATGQVLLLGEHVLPGDQGRIRLVLVGSG